jgi:hypothetical protein
LINCRYISQLVRRNQPIDTCCCRVTVLFASLKAPPV